MSGGVGGCRDAPPQLCAAVLRCVRGARSCRCFGKHCGTPGESPAGCVGSLDTQWPVFCTFSIAHVHPGPGRTRRSHPAPPVSSSGPRSHGATCPVTRGDTPCAGTRPRPSKPPAAAGTNLHPKHPRCAGPAAAPCPWPAQVGARQGRWGGGCGGEGAAGRTGMFAAPPRSLSPPRSAPGSRHMFPIRLSGPRHSWLPRQG